MNASEIKTMMKFMSDNGVVLPQVAYNNLMNEVLVNISVYEQPNLPLVECAEGGNSYTEMSMRDAERGHLQYREDEADRRAHRDNYCMGDFIMDFTFEECFCDECGEEDDECTCGSCGN